jgi:hypothetical protein
MLKPVTASAKSVTGLRDGNDNYIGFFFFFFLKQKTIFMHRRHNIKINVIPSFKN